MIFVKAAKRNGRVMANGACTLESDADAQETSEIAIIKNTHADLATEYFQGTSKKKRPNAFLNKTDITADGSDTATLSNLPDPCTVRVNGVTHEVTGGQLEITASKPATYEIEIRDDPASGETAFPLQAFKATVEAT